MSIRNVVRVSGNQPNGPGERAGLQAGDILLRIGSEPIITSEAFVKTLRPLPPGATINLLVRRGYVNFPLTVTLDQWAEDAPVKPKERGRLGTLVETLLLAENIDGNGPARRMGITDGASVWLPGNPDRTAPSVALAIAEAPGDRSLRIIHRDEQNIAAGVLQPDGWAGRISVDVCFAPIALATPVSELMQRAVDNLATIEAHLGKNEYRLVALVESAVTRGSAVTIRLYPEGQFIQGLPRSVHNCTVTSTDTKLFSQLTRYKKGDVLAFTARLASFKSEMVDPAEQGVNALLDGVPKSTEKIPSVTMRWTLTSIIPVP